jgi:UDP-hydrolysing UDP-N-acetyl-D-glucosamine 2-epimerase
MSKRKICIVTGTRADYGLLYWVIKEIEDDPDLTLQLVVTGAHLEVGFGHTVDVISQDGFHIDRHVKMDIVDDSSTSIAAAMAMGLTGLAKAFSELAPDIIVLLGDRYEALAAAEAALLTRIPLAHISGGETTEGAIDDAMRHAITKMSHIHFTSTAVYRNRVIQLGEDPNQIHNVGALGLDGISRLKLLRQKNLEKALAHPLGKSFFLVTFHPVTLTGEGDGIEYLHNLLRALESFPSHLILFTGVNADPGHEEIRDAIKQFSDLREDRVFIHNSLGQVCYLSAMKICDAVIGNSSSGIVEAPVLSVPTINIGSRQKGRLRAPSIIDCSGNKDHITAAIQKSLQPEFRNFIKNQSLPYGEPGAASRIKEKLKDTSLNQILVKHFYDHRGVA